MNLCARTLRLGITCLLICPFAIFLSNCSKAAPTLEPATITFAHEEATGMVESGRRTAREAMDWAQQQAETRIGPLVPDFQWTTADYEERR